VGFNPPQIDTNPVCSLLSWFVCHAPISPDGESPFLLRQKR
jgi:hypothetical protein